MYWYKRKSFSNPYTEGYIGITNNMKRRNLEHLRNKVNSHFTNALKLYPDIDYIILHKVDTLEEASVLEEHYRPQLNIGWNSAKGGLETLPSVRNTTIIMYHETNPDKEYTFTSITEASVILDISRERISQAKLRKNNVYGYDGWAIKHTENQDKTSTKSIREVNKLKMLGVKKTKPNVFKGQTNRWSKAEKDRISKQHKGKVISEEQKKIVSLKNQLNHTSCKLIKLKHVDSNEIYEFHSISEASRKLNIPLSRLKSKATRPLNAVGKDGWMITQLGTE